MIKNGKLFCFIGAGLFLINAVVFFVFHTSVPIILGIASVIVGAAIVGLALIPKLRIVLDIVSIVVSFVSAYLLTKAIRQLPSAIVVPSNLLVFGGFVLVLVGGVLEIIFKKNSPSAKKRSKSTEDDSATEKRVKSKTPKLRKKKKEDTPLPPPEYYLDYAFHYEPEVKAFIEYLKKENSHLLNEIGRDNIDAYYKSLKIQHSFDDIPYHIPNRETVTPKFFVHLIKWVMDNYCDQHRLTDKLLPSGMNFSLSFENISEKRDYTSVLQLTVDNFGPNAIAHSLIKDDLLKARLKYQKTWNTTRDLKYEDFSSNLAWLSYKKYKEDYDKYCQNLETKALTLVHNHIVDIITPIAKRLDNSFNIYHTSCGESMYIIKELVVEVGSTEGSGKIAKTRSLL